jgi:predicted ATPase
MQKERLVIKNFGPIKSIDLELGKMTIFIGEQATGKSAIAKVLAVCRYFDYLTTAISSNNNVTIDFNNNFENGLKEWGLLEYVADKTAIEYECANYTLTGIGTKSVNSYAILEKENGEIEKKQLENKRHFHFQIIKCSSEFSNLFDAVEELKIKSNIGIFTKLPVSFYQNQVAKVMDNPFYIPTERGLQSIFSLGKSSIQNISDSLFNQFAKMDMFARDFNKETEIKPLNILYKNVNGQGFIKNERQNEFSSLFNGASGYQSIIPVVLAVKYYSENRRKKKTFIVEEPELNLFPKAQKKLMEFFVENINQNGHSFLLPTHSPYFLSAINDLLMAYKKGQKNPTEVEKIVNKACWLNPADLSVYELKNGKAFDIFDKKTGLISDNIIDDASDEMNEEFEELLDIK